MSHTTYTPAGSGEQRREVLRSSRVPPLGDPARAVEDLVERVCHRNGGAKALAGGLIDRSYPQIRKWAGNGDMPGLAQVVRLVELAGPEDPFRPALIAHLEHLFDPAVDPEAVAAEVAARLQDHLGEAPARQAAQIVREVLGGAVQADPETVRRVQGGGPGGYD